MGQGSHGQFEFKFVAIFILKTNIGMVVLPTHSRSTVNSRKSASNFGQLLSVARLFFHGQTNLVVEAI